jgi:hypothetical protein
MNKIGRGLRKWYSVTRDEARARMFFRTVSSKHPCVKDYANLIQRWRIMKQFADGEQMKVLKDTFSIRCAEIDQARAMLESMAKDLAASVYASQKYGEMQRQQQAQQAQQAQQQGTPQAQNARLAQQQQPAPQQQQQQTQQPQQAQQTQGAQPAALNAENLRRNSQAQATAPKGGNKSGQAAGASTTAQSFAFGALSPHGNPSYGGKPPKDMNLQLPPARKKQKTTGQTPQGATPSPQISKKSSPDMRRASESQAPPKPVLLCKEPECEHSTVGFPNEQALQNHIQEEHTKPHEDPMGFVRDNLALALGLEPDGTVKKEKLEAPPMSMTNSKQGQTPATMTATPMSGDGMKRSASSMGKPQDNKAGNKTGATPKPADNKIVESTVNDPWAGSTIDPQTLMQNLGLEKGMGVGFGATFDPTLYRSTTPNDTPDSAKEGSEPNSDISEGVSLDIGLGWASLEPDMLLNMNMGNTSLDGNAEQLDMSAVLEEAGLDPSMLMEPSRQVPDWDEVQVDFSKPFQMDPSHYFMATTTS